MAVMKVAEFIDKLKLAANTPTVYAKGGFGQWMTKGFLASMKTLYKDWYTRNESMLLNHLGSASFDCVCLIKGILWGWDADKNSYSGGAVYGSNGVPDITTETMIQMCNGISTDFSKVEVGELLHMKGHVGIYIGDGKAIESNYTSDENGVTIIPMSKRKWTSHGFLPWVDYTKEETIQTLKLHIRDNKVIKVDIE